MSGSSSPNDEDRLKPNFTEVKGPILKRALEITQEIRHAREVSGQLADSLADEHLEALKALGDYPEMWHTIHDEALNDYEKQVSASDVAKRSRAWRYLELLGEDEARRRADERPSQVAEEMATGILIQRAVERSG
ncbi:hypothetical protein ACQPZP_20645 [Spirillospora sp. CA-142024]|uniref:hypothetical protein n=1 Tax=Spirillospora sp. CA-142024 TaxID=3240036 RepID=UPI003D942C97